MEEMTGLAASMAAAGVEEWCRQAVKAGEVMGSVVEAALEVVSGKAVVPVALVGGMALVSRGSTVVAAAEAHHS